jgi:hypothetical protein
VKSLAGNRLTRLGEQKLRIAICQTARWFFAEHGAAVARRYFPRLPRDLRVGHRKKGRVCQRFRYSDSTLNSHNARLYDAAFGRRGDKGFQAAFGEEDVLYGCAWPAKFLPVFKVYQTGVSQEKLLITWIKSRNQHISALYFPHTRRLHVCPNAATAGKLRCTAEMIYVRDVSRALLSSLSTAASTSAGKKGFSTTR